MSRTLVNFWLDFLLLVSFVAGIFCMAILRVVFPAATKADGWELWGWSYDRWFDLQFGLFSFVALSAVVHVMLHWTWICGVVASRLVRTEEGKKKPVDNGTRTLYGVALLAGLLVVMGVGLFAAMLCVREPFSQALNKL